MSPQYRTREVADVLSWLRTYNAGHRGHDQVSFVGVEHYFTRPIAYDVVERYVVAAEPQRLADCAATWIRCGRRTTIRSRHIELYRQVADKQPYLDHALAVPGASSRASVIGPATASTRIARHAATNIVSFYEHPR